jgi:ribosomal protein L10
LIKADLMTNEQIAQVTGLRVEQITQLRESLESDDE